MNPSEFNAYRRAMLEKVAIVLSDPLILDSDRTAWETFRNSLQDLDPASMSFPNMPNDPSYPFTAEQDAERTQISTDKQAIKDKDAYLTMISRLEQIQTTVNPTNAQIIQAVRDEALYIERIMKVLKATLT